MRQRNGTDADPADWPAGARVRSHYRARWTGVIVDAYPRQNPRDHKTAKTTHTLILRVRMERDRNGRPFRKPRVVALNWAWFERLDVPQKGPLTPPERSARARREAEAS